MEDQALGRLKGLEPDLVALSSLTAACASAAQWRRALATAAGPAAIAACDRRGRWPTALQMPRSSVESVNSQLSALNRAQQWRKGLQLLEELLQVKEKCLHLSEYLIILDSRHVCPNSRMLCSHAGRRCLGIITKACLSRSGFRCDVANLARASRCFSWELFPGISTEQVSQSLPTASSLRYIQFS